MELRDEGDGFVWHARRQYALPYFFFPPSTSQLLNFIFLSGAANFEGEIELLERLPFHNNICRYLFHDKRNNKLRLFMTKCAQFCIATLLVFFLLLLFLQLASSVGSRLFRMHAICSERLLSYIIIGVYMLAL